MGLDITAYSWLTHVGRHADLFCEDEDHVSAYAYSDFPRSFRGIPVLATSGVGQSTFMDGGCYARTDATETHAFQAGSYSGYNRWRADLQQQFNPQLDPGGPFYELIWFADNEGSIGHEAALDLLDDFRQHAHLYVPPSLGWAGAYEDWTRAFELAADGGLVDFH